VKHGAAWLRQGLPGGVSARYARRGCMTLLSAAMGETGMNRIAAALLAILFFAPPAMAAALIEESVKLPAAFPGTLGTITDDLDALVIRPDDGRRHPLAVINHGAPRDARARQRMVPSEMRGMAQEFARRGWVAVTFMRRGYGASEGSYAESTGPCDTASYEPSGRASAQDVREVIRLLRAKPYVDGTKVISVGHSAGGFATVALTADPPPGLVAAISFAGGRGSNRPDEICNAPGLIDAFAGFGRTSRIPMLWVYAENDHYFGPALARQLHAAFTAAGGKAEFVAAPSFGEDGHHMFGRSGSAIWTRYVDAFLAGQNLRLVDQLLPLDPPATGYPGGLGERGRVGFLDYLDAGRHKAFVLSYDGHYAWRSDSESVADAVEEALAWCRKLAGHSCHTVMTDDKPPS
jgi:dienelactone hydrolase